MEPFQPLRNSAILTLILYLIAKKPSTTPFFKIPVNRYFMAFVILQIVSASLLWVTGGIETFNWWLKIVIVYFLVTKLVTTTSRLRLTVFAIVAAISYLCYFSISTYALKYIPGSRAGGFGWYENSNDLSIILVSTTPLLLLLANMTRNMFMKLLYIATAGAFAFNILFTGSRNGLLALLLVGIMSLVVSRNISRVYRSILMGTLVISVLTVGIANVLSRHDLKALSGDDSSENRLVQWKAALLMTIRHPLFGIGPGEFTTYVTDFGGMKGLQPHNTVIQIFAETGIPGGIAFILFAFTLLFDARRLRKRQNDIPVYLIDYYSFLAIALVGFWTCAFFTNRYQFYILYMLIALMVAVRYNLMKRTETPTMKPDAVNR